MRRNCAFQRPANGDCCGECPRPTLEPTSLPELRCQSRRSTVKLNQASAFVRLEGTQTLQKVLWLWKTVGRLVRLMN